MRQVDVAAAAGVSQSLISLIERGHVASVAIGTVRGVFAVLEARFDGIVTWRGGAIDRLLDERHARLAGSVAAELARLAWSVELEVTFNQYGDRGSIDVLALRPDLGTALVVEVKTEVAAVDETIRRLDVKERLAARIVSERWGWRPRTVSRLIVILDTATNRRRVAAHEGSFGPAFPDRGSHVRRWLRLPAARLAGLRFASPTNGRGTRQAPRRPRGPRASDSGSGTTGIRT